MIASIKCDLFALRIFPGIPNPPTNQILCLQIEKKKEVNNIIHDIELHVCKTTDQMQLLML